MFLSCSYMEPERINEALKSVVLHGYTVVPTEEERSGSNFLSSMRDNEVLWFNRLTQAGCIDEKCIFFDVEEDDEE